MRIWARVTLLFSIIQLIVIIGVTLSVAFVVRTTVTDMVEKESRSMIGTISDAVELFAGFSGRDSFEQEEFAALGNFIRKRSIGETGFYFVLNSSGDYLIHPKEEVEGQNWLGKHDFISEILARKDAAPQDRFVRYVSPKTGEMKQVYFQWVEDVDWIICSSAWEHEMYAPIGKIVWLVIGILAVSFIVIVLVTISASRRVGSALGNIADGLKKVGEGDLTTQIPPDTWSLETEQAARQLNEAVVIHMRATVNHIKHSVNESYEIQNDLAAAGEQTGSAIHQISANIQSIRERTEQLRDSIESNTSSVQNITTDIGEVADQINEQSAMIEESTASVNEMLSSLLSVADITRQRKEATAHLTESSQKASQKLEEANTVFYEGVASKIDSIQEAAGTIQKIAAQTNMLAMNAAIEAAHAGEAGYGFAVVADEIRKLAEISSKSSSDITATIKDVVKNIEHSRTSYSEAGNAFAGTYDETRQTADAFSEIEASTQELSGAGKQILTAMTSLQETSSTIQDRITSTKSSIEQILRSQNQIENISSENTSGIQEINTGISEINDAMQMVTKLNTKLGDAVSELEEGIRIFKTESRTEIMDEETGVTLHDEEEPAGG